MKRHLFYIINFFWLSVVICFLYYLLVQDKTFHLSISDVANWAGHYAKHSHLLVIGLIPIYIGLIIFGAAVLFIYLRSSLWPILSHYFNRWLHLGRKS